MRKLLSQNGFMKLLSISMAILLWIFVNTEAENVTGRETNRTFDEIEVSVRNKSDELILLDEPESVSATLRGTRTMLDRVDVENLVFYVDLEDLEEGTHEVPVSSGVPQFEVINIDPQEVEITLDEKHQETFYVDYEMTGIPAEGLEVQEPEITPQAITVSGARTNVERVDRVVAYIDVHEATESLEKGLVVDIYDDQDEELEDIEVTPGMVEVYVPMSYPEKEVDVDVDINDNMTDYYLNNLEIVPEQVTIGGWESVLDEIDVLTTETIDLSRLLEQNTVEIELALPEEGIKEISESTVEVTGEVLSSAEESFEVPVEVPEDLTDEYADLQIEPEIVSLTFTGEQQDIEELTEQDIRAYLDIQEDSGNAQEKDVSVDYPDNNIELVEIDPREVNLLFEDE